MRKTWLWLVLVLFSLCACQPAVVTQPPDPTPQIAVIQYTPSLGWMGEIFSACTLETPGLALIVEEIPAAFLNPENADIVLRWEAPLKTDSSTFILFMEELAIITHPSNPVTSFSMDQVLGLFSGNIRSWDQINTQFTPAEVRVWAYSENDEALQLFKKTIMGDEKLFVGATLLPNPQAMRDEVANDPSSIGLLPVRWLDSSVKSISIRDLPDGMHQPVVVLSRGQPGGMIRDWLLCLQAKVND
jgi:hypothetical protein